MTDNRTSEPHSKKDESGKWVTVSRTFRTVKAAYGYDVDFSQFREGDRIEVIGKEQCPNCHSEYGCQV